MLIWKKSTIKILLVLVSTPLLHISTRNDIQFCFMETNQRLSDEYINIRTSCLKTLISTEQTPLLSLVPHIYVSESSQH